MYIPPEARSGPTSTTRIINTPCYNDNNQTCYNVI